MLNAVLVGSAIREARENERLSPEAILELQDRKFRDLVRFAAASSPFYARLYRSIDLERASPADLPPVNKETIQEHFDEVVTDPRLGLESVRRFCQENDPQGSPWHLGEFIVLLTSGTTGQRGFYIWDTATLADAIAMGFRQSNRGSSSAVPQRIAAVVQIDPSDATNVLLSMIPESAGVKRLFDIRDDFGRICEQLNEFQPTLLASYPYLLWLLAEAAREGRLAIRPQRITSSADVLAQSDRADIREVFGVEPYNYYCSTEFPYLAWECDAHDGLHVNADYLLVESVDKENRPVPPGHLGDKVLVTNLSNRAMPLVRYEMSDQVEYAAGPCPCGCPLPRVRTVAGREEHILTLPGAAGGRVRVLEEHVDDFIGRLEGVARYQVIQEDASRLTLNVVPRPHADWDHVADLVRDTLARCFEKYGVDPMRLAIDLRPVGQLEPIQPGSRKVCRFWNRCK